MSEALASFAVPSNYRRDRRVTAVVGHQLDGA